MVLWNIRGTNQKNMCNKNKFWQICFKKATPLVYLILKSNLPVYSILASAGLNEEQQQIQQMATDFATKELLPNMSTWDQQVTTIRFLWPRSPFI